jgi:hypothetical protein
LAALNKAMRQSIGSAASRRWAQTKTNQLRLFRLFCTRVGVVADASAFLVYLQHCFDSTTNSASTLAGHASALANALYESGLPALSADIEQQRKKLLKAFRKHRPAGRPQELPRCIADLFPHVPRGASLEDLTARVVFGLRVVTMMRPAAPATIVLSSVRRAVHLNGQPIVVFHYRSKASTALGISADTNYLEFLPVSSSRAWLCPATALLLLIDKIEQRARELRVATPTTICVNARLQPLSDSMVSSLMLRIMLEAGWRTQSKDMRRIAQQTLRTWRSAPPLLAHIPADDIDLRGGWTARSSSAVVHKHYSDFRLVALNFADILLGERTGTIIQ